MSAFPSLFLPVVLGAPGKWNLISPNKDLHNLAKEESYRHNELVLPPIGPVVGVGGGQRTTVAHRGRGVVSAA